MVLVDPAFDPGEIAHVDYVGVFRREVFSRGMSFDHFIGLNISEHQAVACQANRWLPKELVSFGNLALGGPTTEHIQSLFSAQLKYLLKPYTEG